MESHRGGVVVMMNRKRASSGFTLVEIMIALSLLGIGLLSLAVMQVTAMQYAARGRHLTKAAAIAEQRMERLMHQTWDDIAPTGWTAPATVNEVVQGPTDKTEQAYEESWRITDVDAGRTRSIDVRVTWTEPNRPTRQYAISGMRFNHEGS
jgi:prepilin-type N-terminal cleavage/methylation domain-containing protein